MPQTHSGRRRGLFLGAALACWISACSGGRSSEPAPNPSASARSSFADITSAIVASQDVTLTGDSIVHLPIGTTTYTGVISGEGTLVLSPAGGASQPSTLVITRASTFTLPAARQVETVTKKTYPGMGYALVIAGSNPPVLTIDPGVTFQIGTNSAADDHPGVIATSDSKNPASVVNGEVNLNNILNDGRIVLQSAQFILLGQVGGSGSITQPPGVWGGNSLGGIGDFTGVLSLSAGQDFGSQHVAASIPKAKAVLNEGSWLVWSPPGSTVAVAQDVYEAAYGNDINFHPIGDSTIVMSGVYSHTDNSPHGAPNLVDPGLGDPSLNMAKVIYRGGANAANGNDGSYRGVNIEAGGTVQWGDGTHARFFLPSAPSPAEVNPPLGKKNAYINLHRGGTLALNYNGPVTLHVGIGGGGGGPDRSEATGQGNVWIMPTAGNDVTFAQPQRYNGTTTIGAVAVLRIGAGAPVPLHYVTVDASGRQTKVLQASYSGDSSLLTAESSGGAATDGIVNDGHLIVQNTSTDIGLSHISGTGSFTQSGAATTTLLHNGYGGGTAIDAGAVVAASADALGTGDVINRATLALASGQHELAVGGSFRQSGGATLRLAIGGATQGVDHDHLTVAGAAVLGGTLKLSFSGAHPAGEKLVLIDAAGGISGAFDSIVSEGASVVAGGDATTFFVTVQ
jgi:hypothetical protein